MKESFLYSVEGECECEMRDGKSNSKRNLFVMEIYSCVGEQNHYLLLYFILSLE